MLAGMKSRFSRIVWVLGFVSLLADVSSELLYPVLPVYLREAGYSMLALGVLEGLANVVAGISKGYFGHLSDVKGKRHWFVRWGYGLSSLGKLLMLGSPDLFRIYIARAVDRLGKGVRTAPRDALLAASSSPESRAAVFGFHRSMDTLGAAIGPLLALWWLQMHPGDYRSVFILAFVPSVLSVVVTFLVNDKSSDMPSVSKSHVGFFGYLGFWKEAGSPYRRLLGPLLLLAVVNSPDTFLLLGLKEAGATDVQMIGAYVLYNLVYALLAAPVGQLADRIGRGKILALAVVFFAITYGGMSLLPEVLAGFLLFVLYALAMAGIESVVKAMISTLVPAESRGKALGFYASANSIGSLIAGVWAGIMWKLSGPGPVFMITAVVALLAGVRLMMIHRTTAT